MSGRFHRSSRGVLNSNDSFWDFSVNKQYCLQTAKSDPVVSTTLGVNSFESLVTCAFPIALYLGPYISARAVLAVKLVRLCVAYLSLVMPIFPVLRAIYNVRKLMFNV